MTLGEMPDECLVETTVTFDAETTNCGLLLRASDDLESYYLVRLEPANNRIVLDRWSPDYSKTTFNDLIVLERRAILTPDRPVKVQLLIDGTALVIYVDDQVALSGRMYDRRTGALGLFVTEGEARFEGLRIGTRS
jgi:beta-fructofuranosidase